MKRIEDVIFNEESFKNYTEEINELNIMCKNLVQSKTFQKSYKKYLKQKNKVKINYNNVNTNIKQYDKKESVNSIKINGHNSTFDLNSKFSERYC